MKWVTREHIKVGRMACTWLIRRFIDSDAEIAYLPAAEVLPYAERDRATPFHVRGAALSHKEGKTSFEAFLEEYALLDNPALTFMGRIVNGADTDNRLYNQPEGPGLRAVCDGLERLGFPSDEILAQNAMLVFDAVYAYCEGKSRQ